MQQEESTEEALEDGLLGRLGGAIRQHREAQGWGQQDVVDRLGRHDTSYISAWENGKKRLSSRHLAQFEQMFDVRIDLLTPDEQRVIDALRKGGVGLPSALQTALGEALGTVLPTPAAPLPQGLEAVGAAAVVLARRIAEAAGDEALLARWMGARGDG